jgi:hypothetical protein
LVEWQSGHQIKASDWIMQKNSLTVNSGKSVMNLVSSIKLLLHTLPLPMALLSMPSILSKRMEKQFFMSLVCLWDFGQRHLNMVSTPEIDLFTWQSMMFLITSGLAHLQVLLMPILLVATSSISTIRRSVIRATTMHTWENL